MLPKMMEKNDPYKYWDYTDSSALLPDNSQTNTSRNTIQCCELGFSQVEWILQIGNTVPIYAPYESGMELFRVMTVIVGKRNCD